MKTIILSFIFMFLRITCLGTTEPNDPDHLDPTPSPAFTEVFGIAIVRTESGEPCKYAKILISPVEFFADTLGKVIIRWSISPGHYTYKSKCTIFKDYRDLSTLEKHVMITLTNIEYWDESDSTKYLYITFPD